MEHKQDINVTLEVKEIIFDIMNKTHLTGHAREAEGKKNYEAASYMQASEDDEASYQIRRSVSNAFAAIKVRLGEYLNEDKSMTQNLIDKEVDNDGQLVLNFLMPSNFHNAAIDSLGNGCHQYIVNRSIADWFVITNPEEAANYVSLADEALDTAKRALYKRARPTRPTYAETEP